MNADIIYEDNHLLVVNKPCGILTQGDHTGDLVITDFYKKYIKEKYNKPGNVFLQPAHRLDRPVSGCIILTRTSKATTRVTTAFRNQEVKKSYLMISDQKIKKEDELVHWLVKDGKSNTVKAYRQEQPKSKKAQLSYQLLGTFKGNHLYLVKPVTGRSHQIRVQMSTAGAPIIGDVKYGGKHHENKKSISLHCYAMTLTHPTTKEALHLTCLPLGFSWKPFLNFLKTDN